MSAPAERHMLILLTGHIVAVSILELLRIAIGGRIHQQDFVTRIACEVKGFDPLEYLAAKEAKRADRFVQFAIAVADEAMGSAGLGLSEARKNIPPERFGVIFGSGIGGMDTFETQTRVLVAKGPKRVSPFFVPMFIPDMAAGMVSIRFGAKGPNYATVSACASSGHALGDVRLKPPQ